MYAQLVDEGLKAEAKFNEHFIKAKAAHSHEATNYGLEVKQNQLLLLPLLVLVSWQLIKWHVGSGSWTVHIGGITVNGRFFCLLLK
jgi:hypothetical protein